MKKTFFLALLFPLLVHAKLSLSSGAEISVVTCGPSQAELYSAFGHSAIRVQDSANQIDLIYNYGVFNFNQPNFYLNFAKGHLRYRLAVSRYSGFVASYVEENRYVHEQILDLDLAQAQRVFDFLQWNSQPENMHYNYDYFYDNCATRIRDAVKTALDDSVYFDGSYITTDYTIRDLCDIYLQQQPWGDFGIDLCLGLPMDKTATPLMYMFLPDYVETGFDHATLRTPSGQKPLVKQTVVVYESVPELPEKSWNTPFFWLSGLLALGVVVTVIGFRRGRPVWGFDVVLFSIIGLLGWFLTLLWLATDHRAAANNLNVLWAMPFHFPLALFLLRKKKPTFLKIYFLIIALLNLVLLIGWNWLPQSLNYALIPLVVLLGLRAFHLYRAIGR